MPEEIGPGETVAGEFKKGLRSNLIAAAATGVAGGVIAALGAAWTLVVTVPGRVGLVPTGAVAAFDLKEGCPNGWTSYDKGAGRFVIGAATKAEVDKIPGAFSTDDRGIAIAERPFGQKGGEQSHLLTEAEMPEHRHTSIANNDNGGFGGVKIAGGVQAQTTGPAGKNQPHNIMPPYVALWLCRKE